MLRFEEGGVMEIAAVASVHPYALVEYRRQRESKCVLSDRLIYCFRCGSWWPDLDLLHDDYCYYGSVDLERLGKAE